MDYLDKLRKNAGKSSVFYCPQCGYKLFKYKKGSYCCDNEYCQLEIGYTGSAEDFKEWKKGIAELAREGNLLPVERCDDEDCNGCNPKYEIIYM